MSSLLLPEPFASHQVATSRRHALEYLTDDGRWSILANQTTRRVVKAHCELFSIDQLARNYFLVESGELFAYRPGSSRQKAVVRTLHDGDLFSFECGERHAANCVATIDSVIRQIDRRVLQTSARMSRVVACILRAMHAAELEMILQSLRCDGDVDSGEKLPSIVASFSCAERAVAEAATENATENAAEAATENAVVLRPDFGPRRTRRI